jgi:hypothetical protein
MVSGGLFTTLFLCVFILCFVEYFIFSQIFVLCKMLNNVVNWDIKLPMYVHGQELSCDIESYVYLSREVSTLDK